MEENGENLNVRCHSLDRTSNTHNVKRVNTETPVLHLQGRQFHFY